MAAAEGVANMPTAEGSVKKRKKQLRLYKKIPAWICEYHQEVLPYIYRAIGSKHLPFSGITLLHFDSHPDLMAPIDMKAENVYNKEVMLDVVSIADWILPAVYVGHIKKVIWIKPEWSQQISDKILRFKVGRHKIDETIRVSCCEKYYCEDGLYVPKKDLENCKELTVVIKTMPVYNVRTALPNGNNHDGEILHPGSSKVQPNCSSAANYCKENNGEPSFDNINVGEQFYESDYQNVLICEVLSHLKEPYILDIDMDFFSTLNPFKVMFSKEEFEELTRFYQFPQVNFEDEVHARSASHFNVTPLICKDRHVAGRYKASCIGQYTYANSEKGYVYYTRQVKMAWHDGEWWPLYVPQWYSPRVSQHIFDPYSFTHILHGVVLYYLWYLLGFNSAAGFLVMFAFELLWEVIENSESVIKRYRESSGTSGEYKGDSYQNIIGDLIACQIGYAISFLFHVVLGKFYLSIAFYFVVEIGLLFYMRDSLSVTLLTLIKPNTTVRKWQEEGVEIARKEENNR